MRLLRCIVSIVLLLLDVKRLRGDHKLGLLLRLLRLLLLKHLNLVLLHLKLLLLLLLQLQLLLLLGELG